jgi:hypothetical protein
MICQLKKQGHGEQPVSEDGIMATANAGSQSAFVVPAAHDEQRLS